MKKFLTIFMATLMLLSIAMFATGCGISDNWQEVKSNLEKEDYAVTSITDEQQIERYLEGAPFNMSIDGKAIDRVMVGMKENSQVIFIFCKDKDTAKDIENQLEGFMEYFAESTESDIKDVKLDCDGTVVYAGHKDAIKAAK